jgi:hypothetical protein
MSKERDEARVALEEQHKRADGLRGLLDMAKQRLAALERCAEVLRGSEHQWDRDARNALAALDALTLSNTRRVIMCDTCGKRLGWECNCGTEKKAE